MHEISVSVVSPEAADHGVAELWVAGQLVAHTILEDSDLMVRIEPRPGESAVVVGARSLAQALSRAKHLLENYGCAEGRSDQHPRAPAGEGQGRAE